MAQTVGQHHPRPSVDIPTRSGDSHNHGSVQRVDSDGNGAGWVRIAHGGPRTIPRVVSVDMNTSAPAIVRLVANAGGGYVNYGREDGAAVTGAISIRNDRDNTTAGMTVAGYSPLVIPPGTHSLYVDAAGVPAGGDLAQIYYQMEVFIGNIILLAVPTDGDTVELGDGQIFEFDNGGTPTIAGAIGVDTVSGTVPGVAAELRDEINTYVDGLDPINSPTPYHYARTIRTEDEVVWDDNGTLTDAGSPVQGVQVVSISPALINGIHGGTINPTNIQLLFDL